MNPFSIITKGGEGNLQIFDRMNFDFSLQINGQFGHAFRVNIVHSNQRQSLAAAVDVIAKDLYN